VFSQIPPTIDIPYSSNDVKTPPIVAQTEHLFTQHPPGISSPNIHEPRSAFNRKKSIGGDTGTLDSSTYNRKVRFHDEPPGVIPSNYDAEEYDNDANDVTSSQNKSKDFNANEDYIILPHKDKQSKSLNDDFRHSSLSNYMPKSGGSFSPTWSSTEIARVHSEIGRVPGNKHEDDDDKYNSGFSNYSDDEKNEQKSRFGGRRSSVELVELSTIPSSPASIRGDKSSVNETHFFGDQRDAGREPAVAKRGSKVIAQGLKHKSGKGKPRVHDEPVFIKPGSVGESQTDVQNNPLFGAMDENFMY